MSDPLTALSEMKSDLALGDAARSNSFWGTAVMHYKAAGAQGIDLGPMIDQRSGGAPATTDLTHRAWEMNGLLSALLNSGEDAKQEDADQAAKFASQIYTWYSQAWTIAQKGPPPPKVRVSVAPAPAAAPRMPAPAPAPPLAPAAPPAPNTPKPFDWHDAQAWESEIKATPVVPTAIGGILGMGFGVRAVGLAIGGPLGLIFGAVAGYALGKTFTKSSP